MEMPQENNLDTFNQIVSQGQTPLHQRDIENKLEIVRDTFEFFKDFLKQQGYTEYQESSAAYKKLSDEKIIVRREDPRRIFELFKNKDGYSIAFENDRYANSVEWNPQTDGSKNIYNAFMEGFTNLNGIVTVIGFSEDDSTDIINMPDSVQDFYGLDRSGVRSFQGTVVKEKIKFITLRIPGHLLPERLLTDTELEKVDAYNDSLEQKTKAQPVMVFRTYLPPTPTFDA